MAKLAYFALVVVMSSMTACAGKQAQASFPMTKVPVLLGPVDRIGGGPLLPTEKTGEYDKAAYDMELHTETGDTRKTKLGESLDGYMDKELYIKHQPQPNQDLRVKELNVSADSSAWILLLVAVFNANAYVGVHGDVVATKGLKK